MNADGTDPHKVVTTSTDDLPSAWSPDGTKILFTGQGVESDLYAVGADGTALTQLTHGPGDSGFGRWSPDGQRIVFATFLNEGTELYSMNADGTNVTRLTYQLGKDTAPDWGIVPMP